jgi:transposase
MDIITNDFTNRTTSGWVEGLNNKIKVLKHRCYGLKNLPNLFRRVWLDLNGYEAFAL